MTQIHILDKAAYISHSTNTLGKGMNPFFFQLWVGQTVFFNLGTATSPGEGKF